jgi:porin
MTASPPGGCGAAKAFGGGGRPETQTCEALSPIRTDRTSKLPGARETFVVLALFAAATGSARADDLEPSLLTQQSLTDTPGGPKEQLRSIGIKPDVWITQFYQGQTEGDASKTWRYGGKMDAFLKVDAEKLGLWSGLHLDAQYEHYFGRNINRKDFSLLPVNTAQAYVERDGYHSQLSLSVTQDFGEHISFSAGKFNMMTLASRTPLIGGGGIDTFMNRAFALPSTGVAYTALRGSAGDRVVISAPYLIGGIMRIKAAPFDVALMIADPRSAIDPRVIERPFEKGVAVGGSATLSTEIAGLRGFHTLRAAYSNARGIDLERIDELDRPLSSNRSAATKKGYWFASYAIQQYLFQSEQNPKVGWGFFTLATLSDGNPNPVRWTVLAGLAGNNPVPGRENDRWGIGYFRYGLAEPLLRGLAAIDIRRRSEGGVEAFYNLAITPWLRLSADLQVIDPWRPDKSRATYAALRLQTKF